LPCRNSLPLPGSIIIRLDLISAKKPIQVTVALDLATGLREIFRKGR